MDAPIEDGTDIGAWGRRTKMSKEKSRIARNIEWRFGNARREGCEPNTML